MNSIVRRKYCMRCNREIYTTWRTLDETKYYHPQCFTCADCGVILESVQDHGVATQEDIYCRRCHNDRFAALEFAAERDQRKSLVVHRTSPTAGGNTKQRGQAKTKPGYADNLDVIFSSPYSKIREVSKTRRQDENTDYSKKSIRSDIIHLKDKVAGKKNGKKSNSALLEDALRTFAFAENDHNFNYVRSRIPRPTSAASKKSLTATATATSLSLSSKSKPFKGFVSKSKNSITSNSKPPSPRSGRTNSIAGPQKMQRSISLMQAKSPGVNGGYHVVPPSLNKSNKVGHQRPRSAVSASAARDDKSHKEGTFVKVSSSITKPRQCAASFEPRKKKENNKGDNRQLAKGSASVSGGSSATVLKPHYSCGGAIPSTQAILCAIQREGSDIFKLKSSSQIPCMSTESYDILPAKDIRRDQNNNVSGPGHSYPKRSFNFNMTFECPICISSLVPTSSSEKGFLEGRIKLGNVVTPCGHLFHLACMENWLKIKGNKRCPICSALCLPETLQPVYLECNLCADLNSKSSTSSTERNGFSYYRDRNESNTNSLLGKSVEESDSFRTLRSQYELLKAKYNEIVTTNNNGFLNAAIANSLQNAYDAECRNRLQLQWENRKLMMKIEELKMAIEPEPDDAKLAMQLNSYDVPSA